MQQNQGHSCGWPVIVTTSRHCLALALLVPILVACDRRSTPHPAVTIAAAAPAFSTGAKLSEPVVAPIATVEPVPVAAIPDVPTTARHFARSVARFQGDTLILCEDVSVDLEINAVSPKITLLTDRWVTDFEKKKTENDVLLTQSCAEAFGDRTALATCTGTVNRTTTDTKVTPAITATTTGSDTRAFYDYGYVGLDDSAMKECLKEGAKDFKSTWTSLPRDGVEWMHAKHEYMYKKLQKDLGQNRL